MSGPHPFFGKQSRLIEMVGRTTYTSHSELIQQLKIRRDELEEMLVELSGSGYTFDAHPHAGVRLVGIPDPITPGAVTDGMATDLIGKIIYHSLSVDSTNSKAIELASRYPAEGAVVVTEYQQRGRGRLGRRWNAAPFSSILATIAFGGVRVSSRPLIVLITALSVTQALRKIGLQAYIRWPNDVVIDGRKICGILAESGSGHMVCGFGLNVNQTEFPRELHASATSVRIELDTLQSRPHLLRSVIEKMDENYDELRSGESGRAMERIREVSWLLMRRVQISNGHTILEGTVVGIDESGRLTLREECGRTLHILPQSASLLEVARA